MKHLDIRTNLYYDPKDLYWLDIIGDIARVGMSPLVPESTGAFVAVQFNAAGNIARGASFGSTEAEKHVGQLKSPVSGTVLRFNENVRENPRLLNTDPYGEGWLMEIQLSNSAEEIPQLIHGESQVQAFFDDEVKKYEAKGWLAEN